MDDSTGRDEPEHGPSTPGGVTDGLERPSFWTDDMERDFQEEVKAHVRRHGEQAAWRTVPSGSNASTRTNS